MGNEAVVDEEQTHALGRKITIEEIARTFGYCVLPILLLTLNRNTTLPSGFAHPEIQRMPISGAQHTPRA